MEERMIAQCIACGSSDWSAGGASNGYTLAICSRCGLTFTLNPDYSPQRYAAAYEASSALDGLTAERGLIYNSSTERLRLETLAYFPPAPWLTRAQKLALRILKAAPPRSVVLDCGCGSGGFLWALHKAGLHGVGVEVSPLLVELLQRKNLRSIYGAAPDFPWEGGEPHAITFFEVLEHFPDPSPIIGTLKKRFPHARIIASVPSPFRAALFLHGLRTDSDFPPHHFTRWTPKALELFFHREGYRRVRVYIPSPMGSELFPGVGKIWGAISRRDGITIQGEARNGARTGAAKRIAATATLWLQRGYQAAMDIVGAPKAYLSRLRGASAGSMLVVAE
jgi:SAM-dependent methyltransferase